MSETPLSLRPENRVRLVVGGVEYGGWKSVRISAGIERQARDFDLEVTDKWPGQTGIVERIRPGDACEVFIGDDKVLTGYVDATPIKYDGRGVSVAVRGRSKTADLVDACPLDAGEEVKATASEWSDVKGKDGKTGKVVTPPKKTANVWRNQKLETIAAALAAPYGVQVVTETDTGRAIAEHQVQVGETVFESIDRMMRLRQVLSTDNADGDLVLIEVGSTGTAETAIELGQNVLACDAPLDYKGVFSEYIVKGQRAGNDQQYGSAVAEEEGVAEDEDVETASNTATLPDGKTGRSLEARATRRRVLVIKQMGMTDEGTAQDRADYEKAFRAAKALQTSYTLIGWRQENGALWLPNLMVRVRDSLVGFDAEMVIAEVSWTLDNSGLRADVRVGPPDGYRPKAGVLKSKKRQKGGGSDWSDVKS